MNIEKESNPIRRGGARQIFKRSQSARYCAFNLIVSYTIRKEVADVY